MKATRTTAPKVVIGSDYRPQRFERRTPTSYEALMPEPGVHAEMLQRGLLGGGHGRIRTWRLDSDDWFVAALYVLAAVFLFMAAAGWLPGQGA